MRQLYHLRRARLLKLLWLTALEVRSITCDRKVPGITSDSVPSFGTNELGGSRSQRTEEKCGAQQEVKLEKNALQVAAIARKTRKMITRLKIDSPKKTSTLI